MLLTPSASLYSVLCGYTSVAAVFNELTDVINKLRTALTPGLPPSVSQYITRIQIGPIIYAGDRLIALSVTLPNEVQEGKEDNGNNFS